MNDPCIKMINAMTLYRGMTSRCCSRCQIHQLLNKSIIPAKLGSIPESESLTIYRPLQHARRHRIA